MGKTYTQQERINSVMMYHQKDMGVDRDHENDDCISIH